MGIQLRELATLIRKRKVIAGALVALTLSIGILIGTLISGRVNATHGFLPNGATPLDLPNPVSLSNAFGAIVERDEPAVVNISTTQVIDRKGQPQNRGGGLDPFHDFFNRFFDAPNEGPEAERSLGSGIIVDKKGFIPHQQSRDRAGYQDSGAVEYGTYALHGQGHRTVSYTHLTLPTICSV